MTVGIYSNRTRDAGSRTAERVRRALAGAGLDAVDVERCEDVAALAPEILAVLGGDGTILGVAGACADAGVPILGVNLGSVGFLSEAEPNDVEAIAVRLAAGDYGLTERTMLCASLSGKRYTALNEIAVLRENASPGYSKVATIEAYAGGCLMDRYVADGVIVSTPTGSTAYSLSAGGAVLSPALAAIQITSVCPHSLHTRPIVVPDSESVTLKVLSEGRTLLLADGNVAGYVEGGEVTVERYARKARFVRFRETSFYERLLVKLNKWSTIKP